MTNQEIIKLFPKVNNWIFRKFQWPFERDGLPEICSSPLCEYKDVHLFCTVSIRARSPGFSSWSRFLLWMYLNIELRTTTQASCPIHLSDQDMASVILSFQSTVHATLNSSFYVAGGDLLEENFLLYSLYVLVSSILILTSEFPNVLS